MTARAPVASTRETISDAIRDFPIPVGPTTVMRWGRSSAAARSQMESTMSSSRDRPTSGAVVAGRSAGAPIGASASHASTGSLFPFASIGSSSW